MPPAGLLLLDANVLVDYQAAGLTILSLVSRHVGKVHIVSTVLSEVEGLDEEDCERLGFTVVEPTLAQTSQMQDQTSKPLLQSLDPMLRLPPLLGHAFAN